MAENAPKALTAHCLPAGWPPPTADEPEGGAYGDARGLR